MYIGEVSVGVDANMHVYGTIGTFGGVKLYTFCTGTGECLAIPFKGELMLADGAVDINTHISAHI